MTKQTRYVLGLMFNADRSAVVLIRKLKPAWQAGLLNGIGGKIEDGETEREGMVREFTEETGFQTDPEHWREFCQLQGDEFVVYCFTATSQYSYVCANTQENERIEKTLVANLGLVSCVSNLTWLIHAALDDNNGKRFYITSRYSHPFQLG